MSNASMICPRVHLAAARFSMDIADEPQKKIFRARKTMKVSDRQQMEAVYKVHEDSLNAEVTLLNGIHENGDSDASLNDSDCMEDRPELNVMLDICLNPTVRLVAAKQVPGSSASDAMENIRDNQDTDFTSQLELLPTEEMICELEDISNPASTELGDQVLDQNKDINFNAGTGTNAEGLDQMENRGSSLCGRDSGCEKDFAEEQMEESGSVKTDLLYDQSVEEMVLINHPEEAVAIAQPLGEELVEAQMEQDLIKDQLELVEEEFLPLQDGDEVGHGPHLVEKVADPQQKELLQEQPDDELTEEPQQILAIPAEPKVDLVPTEELEEERAQLKEALMGRTQLEGSLDDMQQELLEGLQPELGLMGGPQLKIELSWEPHQDLGLLEKPRSEEELAEDQLLEELAEEQQFGEELADDHLLDELAEDQRPEDALEKCEEAKSLLEGEQEVRKEKRVEVAEEEANEEKLEVPENTEVEEEKPGETAGKQDLETEVAVEEQETKERVVEKQEAKEDLKQKPEENLELLGEKAEEMECNWDTEKVEKMEEEHTVSDENIVVEDAGEHAISSSMETDQDSKVGKTPDVAEATSPKPPVDLQKDCDPENAECMETEDIIPILEKLAPAQERRSSLSKPPVLSEVDPRPELEDKLALSQGSASKKEQGEKLPSEAFLVLSDEEEDPCVEVIADDDVQQKQPSPTENAPAEVAEKEPDPQKDEPPKEETPPERSDAARKKRSNSEDMDGVHAKRRRYEKKDYQAEIQVKITTRAGLDQKLQKVIQRLLQDKLCALQCADFDKALAELKTRVEKIECKKHEDALNGMQAKIGRLLKRFGAAKENMKKKQETQAVQPVQPVHSVQPVQPTQPAPQSKAANDGANASSLSHRNITSVRQLLETKQTVCEAPATPVQAPASAAPPPPPLTSQQRPQPTSSNQQLQRIPQTPSSQVPTTVSTPARPMPDWKLIQQRINASHLASPKPQTPATSTQGMAPVLSSPTTTAVVATNQMPSATGQPVSVSLQSLQSLPMILHLPVMQNTMQNGTVMQSTTGTLVTNRQSGKMEFIPSQNQAAVGNLHQQQMSLASTVVPKPNSNLSLPGPTMQRNSQASAAFSGPTLSVQGVSTAQPVTQLARTSMPTANTPGQYTPTANSRAQMQMKSPISSFTSPASAGPPAAPRAESQLNRTQSTGATVAKKAAESTTQGGKGGGFIDLTLDDDDARSSQDARKQNPINVSGAGQPPPLQLRPSQPMQQNMPTGMPSQATIQVLPTAQTTVNVNHRPMAQGLPRLSTPRTPTSHQVVYTTMPSAPIQTPVRNAAMQGQNQGFRQVSPQTGGKTPLSLNSYNPDPRHHPLSHLAGVTVRMPQNTGYMVNNGMTGGPQLTVHHRPPQEPARPIHPAPLPEAPQPQRLPAEAARTSPPQKPHLKLTRVQSQNGIVLSWSVLEVDHSCSSADSYHLYAYHEDPTATTPSQWKKVGEVKALPLPMACTLTQFVSGSKYYFAVRARDAYGRFGVFCDPQSTDVIATQTS